MELTTKIDIITKEKIQNLYEANNINLVGNSSIDKLFKSITNSYLVVSVWENSKLLGLCRVVSDGVFFGRIQELILDPQIKDNADIITDILTVVFERCSELKSFHLNPGVFEKKEIYHHKHFAPTPQHRRLYWSIHEDEF